MLSGQKVNDHALCCQLLCPILQLLPQGDLLSPLWWHGFDAILRCKEGARLLRHANQQSDTNSQSSSC